MFFGNSQSFKPCYKWNTFNTKMIVDPKDMDLLGFKPCYKWNTFNTDWTDRQGKTHRQSFKPCYKWNTFNTRHKNRSLYIWYQKVLNLVISGIPSILYLD